MKKINVDTKLYKQMLRKLLIPAIIMGTMCIVISIINMALADSILNFNSTGIPSSGSDVYLLKLFRGQPMAASITPALVVFMFMGSIVFTFLSFRYMNKRSSSDFYDSLPYSRLNGYISRIGAILTYQYGIILITMLVSVITMFALGINFNALFIPKLILAYMAGSTLIVGGVALAMSITGTLISNAAMSLVILVFPRALLFLMGRIMVQFPGQNYIAIGKLGIFLNPVYNIPTAISLDISRIWQYFGTSETLIHVGAIVYTFILGLIYVLITAFIMRRRKSESAGKGAPNRKIGYLYSALVVLPLLVACFYLLPSKLAYSVAQPSNYGSVIILLVASLAIFLTFNFIITKRMKSLIKSIPVFIIATIVACGIFYGQGAIVNGQRNYLPNADEIEYIKFDTSNEVAYRYKPLYHYKDLVVKDVEFRNEQLIELIHAS